jgi:glutamine synthetase
LKGGQSFVEKHGLWTKEQTAAAAEIEKRIERDRLEVIRFSFADQHGILRGKTVVASEAMGTLRSGCSITSTLLAKDTSHKTVFPVFTPGGGFGLPAMQGAADFLMVPDPLTFQVLPWASGTGWVLCDCYFNDGTPVPFSTRNLARAAVKKLADAGYDFISGLEVEFHLFKIEDFNIRPEETTWPGYAPKVSHTHPGYQYLTEVRFDLIDPALEIIRRDLIAIGLPLRSLELELGPSQVELTFGTGSGIESADRMMLLRSAVKQIARRHGYHASFMCRPKVLNTVSSGWHLHQSLKDRKSGTNALTATEEGQPFSPLANHYLGGLLEHARASAAFTTPTINGYKRYRPYSLAPDRAIWSRDNRGVMIRMLGQGADTRFENRVGEPAANPYLYMCSQIYSGLDGINRKLDPGTSVDAPYETKAPLLPKSLTEALDALRADAMLRAAMGDGFVDYYVRIKDAEVARFHSEVSDKDEKEVTGWEEKEYFDLF